MASTAQTSVPIPEGLDLDTWIVPPPKEPITDELAEWADRKKNKKGKGKGKETTDDKKRGKKKRKDEENGLIVLSPVVLEIETAEERAERERVCPKLLGSHLGPYLLILAQGGAIGTTTRRSILYH